MHRSPFLHRLVFGIMVFVLLLLLALRIQRWFWGEKGLFTSDCQGDFIIYLVPTIEMLKGNDPYRMVLEGKLSYIPGNTPVFLVALLPYSLFSIPVAKVLWWITNLASAIGLVSIMDLFLLPKPPRISRFLFLLAIFLALASTSSAIQIGQSSIIIFFLALLGLTVLNRGHILLSGVLIGLAFSKYSLVFLLIPYLLIDRHFRSLLIAIFIQLGGILIVSWLTATNPLRLSAEYLILITQFASSPTELNLHSRLAEFGLSTQIAGMVSIIGLGVTVLIIVKYMTMKGARTPSKDKAFLIPLLFIGAIPFVYHRLYDGVVFILLAVSWSFISRESSLLGLLTQWPRRLAAISVGMLLIALLYPRNLLESSPYLEEVGALFTTLASLLACFFLISMVSMVSKTEQGVTLKNF